VAAQTTREPSAPAPPSPEPTTAPDVFYDVPRLDRLVKSWREIRTLAEGYPSSRGLLQRGPTQEAPRLKQRSPGFKTTSPWPAIVADVERAWMALLSDPSTPEERLRWKIIAFRMQGQSLAQIRTGCRTRTQTVCDQYQQALNLMSAFLEGACPPDDENGAEP
jgi:hypothetical protein